MTKRWLSGRYKIGTGLNHRRILFVVAAAAAVTAAVVVSLWQGPAARLAMGAGHLMSRFWPGLVLLLTAVLFTVLATRQGRDQQRRGADPAEELGEPRWPWVVSDGGVWTVAGTVLTVGIVALAMMWQIAEHVPAGERGRVQIDAIKYGLGFVAAAGAAVALLLGVRRQQLAEHSHRLELRKQSHTETDAAARRVTDLYTKAVEQLGSADAAVRLGGLYALERVAQENPTQRQTIVDVICAYLRMPYTPPAEPDPAPASEQLPTGLPLAPRSLAAGETRDARQELQVRLTAQRLLTAHLRPPRDNETAADRRRSSFWLDIDLDLTGAHLFNWDLTGCRLRKGTFNGAAFSGEAHFGGVHFSGEAYLGGATFSGGAHFAQAAFSGEAHFERAAFSGEAYFGGATFSGRAHFAQAAFTRTAYFAGTLFSDGAEFSGAAFTGEACFNKAIFTDGADFARTAFTGTAYFAGSTFASRAFVDLKTLTGGAYLSWMASTGGNFGRAISFGGATFTGNAIFAKATFTDAPSLQEAVVIPRKDRSDAWPPGWRLIPSPDGPQLVHDSPDKESR